MKIQACVLVLALCGLSIAPQAGQSATLKTLHQFAGYPDDGSNPMGVLAVLNGKLYGTTYFGGSNDSGVIFVVDPKTGAEQTAFSLTGDIGPYSGLLAWHGALFGTTVRGGGGPGEGSVFKFDPATGAFKTLHSFGDGEFEGQEPAAALIAVGNKLYGTTMDGGESGDGTIFQIDPNSGSEVSLFSFSESGYDYGGQPYARLAVKHGVLYGTTYFPDGNIFSLGISTNMYTVLVQFSDVVGSPGCMVAGLLAVGSDFYGTTGCGGPSGKNSYGTVFRLDPRTGKMHFLHSFRNNAHDGGNPICDLILQNGVLYGTTSTGGTYGKGTVFSVDTATEQETVLYNFSGGADGGDPVAGLTYYQGAFYGTTNSGALGYGTVFELQP